MIILNKNNTIGLMMLFLILPTVLFSLTGCTKEKASASPAVTPPVVTVSIPVQKDLTHYAEFSGTTSALETVQIRARVEGVLHKIHFTPGDFVEKGQLLYLIDPAQYQARLDEAKANLSMKKAEYQLAEATSRRREKAYADKAVSEVAVIQARADLAVAKAGVKASESAVKRAVLNLSYTKITAPISGRTGFNLVDPGNIVGADRQTLLTTIVRDDQIYVHFTINERDFLHYKNDLNAQPSPVQKDTAVLLALVDQNDHPYEGRIDYIDHLMDPASGTIRVRAVFTNPDHRLLPGLYAKMKIPLGSSDKKILVPDTVISRDQQGHYLLVADTENKVQRKPVTIGPVVDGMRVISQGLSILDRVIVNGLQKARPGALVSPVENNRAVHIQSEKSQPSA